MEVAGGFQDIKGRRECGGLSGDKSEILRQERVPALKTKFENHRVGRVPHLTEEEAGCVATGWALPIHRADGGPSWEFLHTQTQLLLLTNCSSSDFTNREL